MYRNARAILQLWVLLIGATQLFCSAQNQFHFSPSKTNWFEASEYCTRMGMRLVIVESAAKNDALIYEAKGAPLIAGAAGIQIWMGASDLGRTNTYIWRTTGKRMTYTQWNNGEPSGGNEHCATLWYDPTRNANWKWNDVTCTVECYAACESDPTKCKI